MRRSHNDRSREKNSGKNRNTDLKRAGRSVRIGRSIRGAGGSGHDSICVNRMFKTEKEKWETVRYW